MKNLNIRINLGRTFNSHDLKIRQTLSDTLEDRGIGEVWDEGMGDGYIEVNVMISSNEIKQIKSILKSLGILENSKLTYGNIVP